MIEDIVLASSWHRLAANLFPFLAPTNISRDNFTMKLEYRKAIHVGLCMMIINHDEKSNDERHNLGLLFHFFRLPASSKRDETLQYIKMEHLRQPRSGRNTNHNDADAEGSILAPAASPALLMQRDTP